MTQMHEYTMQQSAQKTREMQVTIEQLELQLSRFNPEIRLKVYSTNTYKKNLNFFESSFYVKVVSAAT